MAHLQSFTLKFLPSTLYFTLTVFDIQLKMLQPPLKSTHLKPYCLDRGKTFTIVSHDNFNKVNYGINTRTIV